MSHNIEDIITIFNRTFFKDYNTKLIRGDDEPIYLPSSNDCNYHQIIFAHGYYASALHEIAHWCVAGKERRLLEDFGYWYEPDGRSAEQQKAFEQVEIKPQAIEWALCAAANKKFDVSVDNLNGVGSDRLAFKAAVYRQLQIYLAQGFPARVVQLMSALSDFYQTKFPNTSQDFLNVSPC
ncbi:elongation factor P hydroxylase [Thalassotalea atypica]|uniref:elongation factor P hydroxylase n=1 Tax=Thalassotalea atypica TaxID=2054316 RepID=UPI00257308D3|nr:elongation factor P hydroxylase [Thalassotalea atypica]